MRFLVVWVILVAGLSGYLAWARTDDRRVEVRVEYGDRVNVFRIEREGKAWALHHHDSQRGAWVKRTVRPEFAEGILARAKGVPEGERTRTCPRKTVALRISDSVGPRTGCLGGDSVRSRVLTGLSNELAVAASY